VRSSLLGGRGRGLSVYAFLIPLFLILALLVYFPIARSVAMSLTDQSLLRPNSGRFVGFANFHETLTSPRFWRLCIQTLAWTVFSVAGAVGLGVGAALLVHNRRHGAPVAKALLLVPWILPPVVSAFTWGYMYRDSGPLPALVHDVFGSPPHLNMLANTDVSFLSFKLPLWCVIQVGVWSAFPFVFLFTLAALATIPPQLYEAGQLDGATETRLFFWITLPLIAPVLETATLLLVLIRFGGFDLPFLLTQGGPSDASNVLGVYIYGIAFQSFDIGKGAAIGLILFVLTLPLSLLYVWRAGRQLAGL
jgi:multiple sugar transport system permease protein